MYVYIYMYIHIYIYIYKYIYILIYISRHTNIRIYIFIYRSIFGECWTFRSSSDRFLKSIRIGIIMTGLFVPCLKTMCDPGVIYGEAIIHTNSNGFTHFIRLVNFRSNCKRSIMKRSHLGSIWFHSCIYASIYMNKDAPQ
jgi:hypothetical protein